MISLSLIRQVIAFGCVGVIATMTHYLVALTSVETVNLSVYSANIVGYVTAVFVSLFGHSIFTYQKKLNSLIVQRFFIVSLGTLVVSEVILFILKSYFPFSQRVVLAIVVCLVPIVTFFLNKFWVYAATYK